MTLTDEIQQRLLSLSPIESILEDQSAQHAGHAAIKVVDIST